MTSAVLAEMDDAIQVEPYPAFQHPDIIRKCRDGNADIARVLWSVWRYMRDRDAAMLGYCDLGGGG